MWTLKSMPGRVSGPYPFGRDVLIADRRVSRAVYEKMARWEARFPEVRQKRRVYALPNGRGIRIVARNEAAREVEVEYARSKAAHVATNMRRC